jgi:hypothetical protein
MFRLAILTASYFMVQLATGAVRDKGPTMVVSRA